MIESGCVSGIIKKSIGWRYNKMCYEEKIENIKELEFAVFCIENVAERLGQMRGGFMSF